MTFAETGSKARHESQRAFTELWHKKDMLSFHSGVKNPSVVKPTVGDRHSA